MAKLLFIVKSPTSDKLPRLNRCLGKRRRQLPDAQEHNDDDWLPSWDNGSVFNCQYDDGYADSDVENLDILVSQPCQVCLRSTKLKFSMIKLLNMLMYTF